AASTPGTRGRVLSEALSGDAPGGRTYGAAVPAALLLRPMRRIVRPPGASPDRAERPLLVPRLRLDLRRVALGRFDALVDPALDAAEARVLAERCRHRHREVAGVGDVAVAADQLGGLGGRDPGADLDGLRDGIGQRDLVAGARAAAARRAGRRLGGGGGGL